jgi:hypothetical protein
MKGEHGDLERLRGMSAGEDRVMLSGHGHIPETPGTTGRTIMTVAGIALILGCAVLLFFAYGIAEKATDPSDPAHGSHLLEKMFGLHDGGWLAVPGLVALVVGAALLFFAIGSRKA